MKKNKGWTIVQTMVVILIAGFVISGVVRFFINEACEAEPSRPMCAKR